MSIVSMTRAHTVTVLEPTEVVGAEFGRDRTYAAASPARVITCTLSPGYPGDSVEAEMLMQRGVKYPHTMYTSSYPQVDERHRLKFGSTILRIMGVPRDVHGQGRLWVTLCEARTEDNENTSQLK